MKSCRFSSSPLFFGLALGHLHRAVPGSRSLVNTMEEARPRHAASVTDYVMRFAPIGVFGAVAPASSPTQGLGMLVVFGKLSSASFYMQPSPCSGWYSSARAGCTSCWARKSSRLLKLVREPTMLLGFSTASSESAYPEDSWSRLEKFGVQGSSIIGFVLPLGYSFNLDGSMLYLRLCRAVHRRRPMASTSAWRTADHHAAGSHDLEQGRRRRAAFLAGCRCCRAADVRPARGRAAADHGHRPVPRHGPHRHQRDRQQRGHRGGREVGRRARRDRGADQEEMLEPAALPEPAR